MQKGFEFLTDTLRLLALTAEVGVSIAINLVLAASLIVFAPAGFIADAAPAMAKHYGVKFKAILSK